MNMRTPTKLSWVTTIQYDKITPVKVKKITQLKTSA